MEEKGKLEMSSKWGVHPIYCSVCGGPTFCYFCWNGNQSNAGNRTRAEFCVEMTFGDTTYDRFHLCERDAEAWKKFDEPDKARWALACQEKMRTFLKGMTQK